MGMTQNQNVGMAWAPQFLPPPMMGMNMPPQYYPMPQQMQGSTGPLGVYASNATNLDIWLVPVRWP